jgi:hypothetical protein
MGSMDNIRCWLQSTLQRVFPSTPVSETHSLQLIAARNERVHEMRTNK